MTDDFDLEELYLNKIYTRNSFFDTILSKKEELVQALEHYVSSYNETVSGESKIYKVSELLEKLEERKEDSDEDSIVRQPSYRWTKSPRVANINDVSIEVKKYKKKRCGLFDEFHVLNHDNLIVFDWDDTCFASSVFLKLLEDNTVCPKWKEFCKRVDDVLADILTHLHENYNIVFITNGQKVWIKQTIKFYPKTQQLIKDTKIPFLISQGFVKAEEIDLLDWKKYAFDYFVEEFGDERIRQQKKVFVFGDNLTDVVLSKFIQKKYEVSIGMIKLNDDPTREEVFDQIRQFLEFVDASNEKLLKSKYSYIQA
jgi:hypothetical protein